MSKKDLIDAVAKDAELTKEKASVAVDAALEHIRGALRKGEEVRIPDFGTFKVAKRWSKRLRNSFCSILTRGSSRTASIRGPAPT